MRLGALVCQKAALDLDIQHGLILSTAAADRRSVARWANSPTAHGPRRNAPHCHGPTAHGACVLRNMPNVAERQSERACGPVESGAPSGSSSSDKSSRNSPVAAS